MEWQPMGTAPKDGSLVEVFDPRNLNNIPGYRGWIGPAKWTRWGYWRKMHRFGFINMVAEPAYWRPYAPPRTTNAQQQPTSTETNVNETRSNGA